MENILECKNRTEFRAWLFANADTAKECYLPVKRGKTEADGIAYLDAVEEALCFGWIDSTVRKGDCGLCLQRFSKRGPKSGWTELNKARARRLIRLGMMTDAGHLALQNAAPFAADPEIEAAFAENMAAAKHFASFPALYRRIKIDNIQRSKADRTLFDSRLAKLIAASERGEMFGEWNDAGRLSDKDI